MNVRFFTLFLSGFLMIALPVGLAIILTRKFRIGWHLFWAGAATFILSQVVHIPFNLIITPVFDQFGFIALQPILQLLIKAAFFGLSAGVFEELSRYGMYRWWAKEARSWGKGLLVGAGHGGIEAILLGVIMLYEVIQIVILSSVDISQVIPATQVDTVRAQLEAILSMPVYMTFLGALERMFSIPVHLACSLLVLQTFTRRKFWWMGMAVLFHALVDGIAVYAMGSGLSAPIIEAIIGIFSIVGVIIIIVLRQPEPGDEVKPVNVPVKQFIHRPVEETDDNLEKTRYQ